MAVLEWERKLRDELDVGGLWSRDTLGPTRRRLRPYNDYDTPGFPVYSHLETHDGRVVDLEEYLLSVKEHPDRIVAHVMAVCAAYAYSDAETVSTMMARMGLLENTCRMVSASVDAMFIHSTACLIQSRSGRVGILCYRGTEPMSFINWLVNADVDPERMGYHFGDPCATVHAGFYRNVRATRHEVMWALKRACRGESVRRPLPDESDGVGPARVDNRLEALYVTGHSLGGALAAMMGVMLRHERKFRQSEENIAERLKAIYTFGQPMIGDPSFAEACEKDQFLRDNMIRYVYDNDVVPHLPSKTSGPFRHFGHEWRYRIPHAKHGVMGLARYLGCSYNTRQGDWKEQMKPSGQALSDLGGFGLGLLAFATDKIKPLRSLPVTYSIEDHRPQHYITALTPYGVPNEFGD